MSTLPAGDPGWDANGSLASRATAPMGIPGEPCSCGCGRKLCEWDACAHLAGRQERFASEACKNSWYALHRPRVLSAAAGAPRRGSILSGLIGLLADGEYHDVMAMSAELKALPQTVSARIREARAKGFQIERDMRLGAVNRAHRYRLVLRG